MADEFRLHVPQLDDPCDNAEAAALSDTVDLSNSSRALYVGVAGDVKVDMVTSGTVTFKDLAVGWHPIRCERIYSTGTAATDIIVVW